MKKRTLTLGLIFITLQLADALLTQWAVANCGVIEQNPLMAPIVSSPLFLIVKIVPALIVVPIMAWITKRYARLVRLIDWGLTGASIFYIVILAGNITELI